MNLLIIETFCLIFSKLLVKIGIFSMVSFERKTGLMQFFYLIWYQELEAEQLYCFKLFESSIRPNMNCRDPFLMEFCGILLTIKGKKEVILMGAMEIFRIIFNLSMTTNKALVLLLVLLAVGSAQPLISEVYTDLNDKTAASVGSTMGGTRVYFEGSGFDTSSFNPYIITIGDVVCDIDEGVDETRMNCITRSWGSYENANNKEIKVFKSGGGIVGFAKAETFSYQTGSTPLLYAVSPSVNYGGKEAFWLGKHRVSSYGNGGLELGDLIAMEIGNDTCQLIDVAQTDESEVSADDIQIVNSISPLSQKAGLYDAREHNTAGYSYSNELMVKSTLGSADEYTYAVLPAISSITSSGSIGGNTLQISGTGFSATKAEVSVTVDDVPCAVTSSSRASITCELEAKTNQDSAISTNGSVKSYESGNGFFYERYDISAMSSKTVADLKNVIDDGTLTGLTLQEKAIRGEVKSVDSYGSNYGQVWKGYFVATVTGEYTFRGLADDQFRVYLSNTTSNQVVNFTTADSLLSVSSAMVEEEHFSNWYETDKGTDAEQSLTLTAGNRYYMEVYHVNVGGSGWFELGIQVPNTDASIQKWQSHEVQIVETAFTADPEIVVFNVSNAETGDITYKYYERENVNGTWEVKYDQNATTPFNATASEFCDAIKSLRPYSGYPVSCTLTMYDSDHLTTTDSSLAVTFQYTATVTLKRTDDRKTTPITLTGANMTETVTQEHSDLITGTFTLQIGGNSISVNNSTDIPFGVSEGQLEYAIRESAVGLDLVEVVQRKHTYWANYGQQWIIYFIGYNADIPAPVVSGANLAGGVGGNSVTIAASTRREYSANLLVEPLDFRFMSTFAAAPAVRVTVNSLEAVCLNDCSYTFIDSVPEVSAVTLTGATLAIDLANSNLISNPLSDVSVTLDGQTCSNVAGSLASFTCDLPTNTDGSPIIRAGDHLPVVSVSGLGIIPIQNTVTALTQALAISAVNPTSGGTNGGYSVVLTATGLPLLASDATFTVCGRTATISAISNIEATISAPQCATTGADSIVVSYNSLTANSAFTYNAPTNTVQITSISPSSASPVMKNVLTITGSGFGTNTADVEVWLNSDSGKDYQLRVLSVTDTEITAGLSGGLPGTFEVDVTLLSAVASGNAVANPETANDFTYEVSVSSISPTTGSKYGGTLLTITGTNFIPDGQSDTMVTVGNEMNQLCSIQSITATEIKCRTPAMHADESANTAYGVLVNNKLRIDSTCSGTCDFSYVDEASSPVITNLSTTSMITGNLTITGERLNVGGGACVVVLYNIFTKVSTPFSATTCSATEIVVNITANVESGLYYVKVRSDPVGESNPFSQVLEITLGVSHIIPTSLSVKGGKVTFQGFGFPASWPATHYSDLSLSSGGKSVPLDVVSSSTSELVINIPEGVNGQSYSLTIKSPTGSSKTPTFNQTNSQTPTVSLTSSATPSAGTVSVTLNRTDSLTVTLPELIQVYSVTNMNAVQNVSGATLSGSEIAFDVTLKSGKYGFKLLDAIYGWYSSASFLEVSQTGSYSVATTSVSFNGGQVVVSGADIGEGATVTVEGQVGHWVSSNATDAVFEVPALVTPTTQSALNLVKNATLDLSSKTVWGDSSAWESAFDGDHTTNYESNNSACFIGVDMGSNVGVYLTRIRFFPYKSWAIASNYIKGGKFEGSNDNSTWTEIATIDQTVHAGWNSILLQNQSLYQYVRFSHTNDSNCMLAEFELAGIEMSQATVDAATSHTTDLTFNDGVTSQTFTGAIEYRADQTAKVTAVTPARGDVFGGYDITLTGEYLNIGTPSVVIDGVECVYVSHTATEIVCTVGSRTAIPDELSFVVMVGGTKVLTEASFDYVLRYSDVRTWGTDLHPVEGDMVYVPSNMRLLMDESTEILAGIVVSGGILEFADEADMVIQAGIITVQGGKFIAGTEASPYQHKLTFIMHGNSWDKQQPILGNKGIGCFECDFSMHGIKRQPTWTEIKDPINAGDTTFTTMVDVDWVAGEEIAVASTSYNHLESEKRTIASVAADPNGSGKLITVTEAFEHYHHSGVETHGTDTLEMRAEVALLTRNIQMMGDDNSIEQDYGSHLMLAGSAENGFVGRVAYVEFTKCGQPEIVGRYCHHFHMNGDVPESYSIGNAVHNSMARILTLHGVHFLYVAWNVGWMVEGHNFFLEDGIETNNILEHNLAISSLASNKMMQTDISVASYWVTNPFNHLRFNRAAGGDFYGYWYEIKEHPDGPSATSDICPQGFPLGESHDNVAHSYLRFGLRIFRLSSRERPCDDTRDNSLEDPFTFNPSIESRFYNYVTYKCGESGLLAEETGHTVFENFVIAESVLAGMEFYRNNLTREDVKAINISIIGKSSGNPSTNASVYEGFGAILPRSGNLDLDNVRFNSFTNTQKIWQACSKCDDSLLYTNMGAIYKSKNIAYNNIHADTVFYNMLGLKRDIFYDSDGTLFSTEFDGSSHTSGTLVFGFPHLWESDACSNATNPTKWAQGVLCTGEVQQIAFTNLEKKSEFQKMAIKIKEIADTTVVVSETETVFTNEFSLHSDMEPKEQKETYSFPFIAGKTYNVWWGTGIDFTHVAIDHRYPYVQNQSAVIFKFNYTTNRELYEIGPQMGSAKLNNNATSGDLITASTALLDASTCTNGQYYHDNSDGVRQLHVCSSAKNKKEFQYLSLNAIYCRYVCPAPAGTFVREDFVRKWSNDTQWPNGAVPVDGENVTIPGEWNLLIDVQPAQIAHWLIDGLVSFDELSSGDVTIIAETVWIRHGQLKIGVNNPIQDNTFTLQLNGNKDDNSLTIDQSFSGNKVLVVNGLLEVNAATPGTQWTKLKSFATAGDTSIEVLSADGWALGDEITIAPSFTSRTEFERRTITAISGTTISFADALQYSHYGAASETVTADAGSIDTRAGVGHMTRKVRFTSGADSGWGYSIYASTYTYEDTSNPQNIATITKTGRVDIDGAEFVNGGQYDTEQSALHFKDVIGNDDPSIVQKSTFSDCLSFCINVDNSHDLQITNNVFYNARKFHAQVTGIDAFTMKDNLMIGAIKRPTTTFKDLIACLNMYQALDFTSVLAEVSGNLCQGSEGHGFVIPTVPCDDIAQYPFSENTVGSAEVGFILNKASSTCIASTGLKAYATAVGQIINPAVSEIRFTNFTMVDNQRAVSLRIGGKSAKKTAWLNDSYIAAISRPDCPQCYGSSATTCTNLRGIRMLAIGSNSESLPDKFGAGFDVICREETISGNAFSHNVEFAQWRNSYSNANLTQCGSNRIFFPHTISDDITGSHHFWNSKCTECDFGAIADFIPPDESKLGWFGGCGQILCTGMNNYMIFDHDTDGDFFPSQGVLLANNSWIGEGQTECTHNADLNGYFCTSTDYAVLEYESIAPDFNTRIMWPVYLSYEGGSWESETNGWIEWEWEGGEPLNLRRARFVSILKMRESYDMRFTSEPPSDMVFEFQRRSVEGNASDYAIIKITYLRPNSIQVQNNGVTIKPISLLDNNGEDPIDPSVCGSNKFFYENYTIQFAVHEGSNCRVRVSLVNSVQLTARFNMPIADFFANDGATKFINRMSAILGITDTSRIKIVGIYQGSTVVVTNIDEEAVPEENSTTADSTTRASAIRSTRQSIDSVIADGSFASEMTAAGLGTVESVAASTLLVEEEAEAEADNTGMIIGIALGGVAVVCLVIITGVCYMRKRAKIGQIGAEELPFETESHKEGDSKDNKVSSDENFSIVDLNSNSKDLKNQRKELY